MTWATVKAKMTKFVKAASAKKEAPSKRLQRLHSILRTIALYIVIPGAAAGIVLGMARNPKLVKEFSTSGAQVVGEVPKAAPQIKADVQNIHVALETATGSGRSGKQLAVINPTNAEAARANSKFWVALTSLTTAPSVKRATAVAKTVRKGWWQSTKAASKAWRAEFYRGNQKYVSSPGRMTVRRRQIK